MKKIYKLLFVVTGLLLGLMPVNAQRQMETLDRGLVAIKVPNGVFASWRIQGYEWDGVTYNIYRDGSKLNSEPLEVSNYQDNSGTLSSSYTVTAIVKGVEQDACPEVQPLSNQYLEIPMVSRPAGYEVNDATTADLDGDGEYEIIVKRIFQDYTPQATHFAYFEAYKMDGTLMWAIDVGPNIMSSSAVEINIAAFDFDEDGKAEVFLRTSEGTIFGDGAKIGDTDGDNITNYRFSVLQTPNMEYMTEGPEFLSLVDGETGVELDRVDFIPRISAEWWGDGYGHRGNKFFFGAPYLDGKKPSLFIGRGIYTKTIMCTYDVVNKELVKRWEFRATDSSDPYFGQGNHNFTIADVDMDGRDEIVWGSMTVDDNGEGLYSTDLGHGDALHVGDLDPYRKGTEIFKCLEESPGFGTVLYDGATGEILIHHVLGRDCGRCCAANISDDIKGKAVWGGGKLYSASTKNQINTGWNSENYRIYWDGDLLEELLDKTGFSTATGYGAGVIQKYGVGDIFVASGTASCNYTKGTPSLQADLFGDWREEVVWRTNDNTKIRIYTTIDPTPYRNYTLMHDHQYRQAICWQMCGYNQPPHVSYFLGQGENIVLPPPPTITNGRLVYDGTGTWDKTSSAWLKDGQSAVYTDGEHVHFDVLKGEDVTLSLAETVSPSAVTVNSPGNYTLSVSSGKISGTSKLVKQGIGAFSLNGDHDYSGVTEIWTGRLNFNGTLSNSPVWMNLFGEMAASGSLNKGLTMRYSSELYVGGDQTSGSLTIADSLSLENKATIILDMYAPSSGQNDVLTVNGKLITEGTTVIRIIPHLEAGISLLEPGNYTLMAVSGEIVGNIANATIEGIQGTSYDINLIDGNLVLAVKGMRDAASVTWNGNVSNQWNLASTNNFLNGEIADLFVTGDAVILNDNAVSKTIDISETVNPSSILVDADSDYIFNGTGSISGDATLTKTGTGKLLITNNNDITGKVTINEGNLVLMSMPSALKQDSPIGPTSSDPSLFEINGGRLSIMSACDADRAVSIGSNGGTIYNNQKVKWNTPISGGNLTKTGAGEIAFTEANTISKIMIQQGTVSLYDEDARPAQTVVFEGGTLQSFDNSYSYSTDNLSFNVPEGKTGTLRLDARCTYKGTLTGSGTLNLYTPWIRSELQGNWSSFSGDLNVTTDGDGGIFILGNSSGYGNASVYLNNKITCIYQHSVNATIPIGELSGNTSSYLGAGGQGSNTITWKVGGKNTDAAFKGVINNAQYKNSGARAAIIKTGTGKWVLTNENTYSGGTTVEQGSLMIQNITGSGTGTGLVYVKSNGVLGGTGTIGNSVTVQSGGTIAAGYNNTIANFNIGANLIIQNGGILEAKVNADNNTADRINISGSTTFGNITLSIRNVSGTYSVDDQFKLIDCSSIIGNVTNITPEIPAEGLVWDLSEFNSNGIIKVAQYTGIGDYHVQSLKFHPNPTKGKVSITLPESASEVVVKVQNMNGSNLYHSNYPAAEQLELDLSSYGKGIFIIQVVLENKLLIGKVVVK